MGVSRKNSIQITLILIQRRFASMHRVSSLKTITTYSSTLTINPCPLPYAHTCLTSYKYSAHSPYNYQYAPQYTPLPIQQFHSVKYLLAPNPLTNSTMHTSRPSYTPLLRHTHRLAHACTHLTILLWEPTPSPICNYSPPPKHILPYESSAPTQYIHTFTNTLSSPHPFIHVTSPPVHTLHTTNTHTHLPKACIHCKICK